jgi:hypothetical protein
MLTKAEKCLDSTISVMRYFGSVATVQALKDKEAKKAHELSYTVSKSSSFG